jgi:hypothetical protein
LDSEYTTHVALGGFGGKISHGRGYSDHSEQSGSQDSQDAPNAARRLGTPVEVKKY